eukprot:scaffold12401_cov133-Isochrysis_galbana.AAC.5
MRNRGPAGGRRRRKRRRRPRCPHTHWSPARPPATAPPAGATGAAAWPPERLWGVTRGEGGSSGARPRIGRSAGEEAGMRASGVTGSLLTCDRVRQPVALRRQRGERGVDHHQLRHRGGRESGWGADIGQGSGGSGLRKDYGVGAKRLSQDVTPLGRHRTKNGAVGSGAVWEEAPNLEPPVPVGGVGLVGHLAAQGPDGAEQTEQVLGACAHPQPLMQPLLHRLLELGIPGGSRGRERCTEQLQHALGSEAERRVDVQDVEVGRRQLVGADRHAELGLAAARVADHLADLTRL